MSNDFSPFILGSIPVVRFFKSPQKKKPFSFDCVEDCLDPSEISRKQTRDWKFFWKINKYTSVKHFVHHREPFSHVYEKQYWNFTFFNRVCFLIRRKFSPLNSDPFSFNGNSSFFEFETLNSPQRCSVYVARSRDLSLKNLKRFSRSMEAFTSDMHEELIGDNIFSGDSFFTLSKLVFTGKTARFVKREYLKDEVPSTKIDRHAWPDIYIEKDKVDS